MTEFEAELAERKIVVTAAGMARVESDAAWFAGLAADCERNGRTEALIHISALRTFADRIGRTEADAERYRRTCLSADERLGASKKQVAKLQAELLSLRNEIACREIRRKPVPVVSNWVEDLP